MEQRYPKVVYINPQTRESRLYRFKDKLRKISRYALNNDYIMISTIIAGGVLFAAVLASTYLIGFNNINNPANKPNLESRLK